MSDLKICNPERKYKAKASVVAAPNWPHSCTVYAFGYTLAEFTKEKRKREAETGLVNLPWVNVNVYGHELILQRSKT